MEKKFKIFSVLVITLAIALSLINKTEAFQKPNLSLPKSKQSSVQFDSAAFENYYMTINEADVILRNSLLSTSTIILNKEEKAKLKVELEAINEIKDPKEKKAKLANLYKTQNANLEAALKTEEIKSKLKGLSDDQKQQLGNSIYNLSLAALKDKEAISQIMVIVKSIQSDPTLAFKHKKDLKNALVSTKTVGSQAKSATLICVNIVKMMKPVGLDIKLPKDGSGKPKKVEFDF